MQVSFAIPGPLREFTGHQTNVKMELPSGANLSTALRTLFTEYPGLRDRVTTESGEIRRHVTLFVGKEDVRYTGGLMTSIPAGAEISIVPSISGGQ